MAIAGFGRVAVDAHVPAYVARPRFEVVAVTDPVGTRLEAARRVLPSATAFRSVDAMLEVDFDVLDVCSPPIFHAGQTRAALEAGRHVLCEKPLARSGLEYSEIVRTAQDAQRLVYPCHNWRFAPAISQARRLIAAGAIGEPQGAVVCVERCGSARGADESNPDWRQQPSIAGGGIWTDHGPHVIYVAESLLGARLTEISLRSTYAGQAVEQEVDVLLQLDERRAAVQLTWLAGRRRTAYSVTGTEGELAIVDGFVWLRGRRGRSARLIRKTPLDDGVTAGWYRRLLDDLTVTLDEGDLRPDVLDEAGRVALAIESGYASAAAGGTRINVAYQAAVGSTPLDSTSTGESA